MENFSIKSIKHFITITKITPILIAFIHLINEIIGFLGFNDVPLNYVYVANMCKADFLGSSIDDERHLCLYVKDVIDDPDGYDGLVFNRWYADMCRQGIPIDWHEFI